MITVGMPVYNAGECLFLAVNSIINQSYDNWELLIIDDGSTDNAVHKLTLDGVLSDPRIRVISDGKNKGLAARLNEAIDLSNGKYFARMDQDDISLPTRFEEQLNFLVRNPTIDLLATRVRTIDNTGCIKGELPYSLTHETICAKPWRSFYMPHPTWMGHTSWFRKFRYPSPAPFFSEDQELLLRSYKSSKFASLDEVFLYYRIKDYVNIRKLLLTHLAIYKLQCQHFLKENFFYLIPSTVIFLVRLIKVLFNFLKQKFK